MKNLKLDPNRPDARASELTAQMEDFRRRIDQLDEELVRLLNARAACALEVGRLKEQLGVDLYQPAREMDVLRHVRNANTGPLNAEAITRLFERIIDEARRLERVSEHEG